MYITTTLAALMLLATVTTGTPVSKRPAALTDGMLHAIMMVESGGNDTLVGDKGKAIGAFQIHKAYWQDAVEYDKTLGGTYEDCRRRDYARKVVIAYMTRYAPKNATPEQLARIHNGGAGILKRVGTKAWNNTTAYWKKVQKHLK
jgi:hypothetical protein